MKRILNLGAIASLCLMIGVIALVGARAHAQTPQFAVAVQTEKFIFRPGDKGKITVRVFNYGPEAKGTITLRVQGGLGSERVLDEKNVTVAAYARGGQDFPLFEYTASGDEGGRGFVATFAPVAGVGAVAPAPVTGSEYSIVSDNPLRVAQLQFVSGATGADAWTLTPEAIQKNYSAQVRDYARASYCGIYEISFWAPDDFAMLAPQQDIWRSGQTYAFMYKPALKAQIDEAHRQGMWSVFYANTFVFGPYGFDLARKHPDWFQWDENWYGGTFRASSLSKRQWELPEALHPVPKPPAPGQPPSYNVYPHNWDPGLQAITPLVTKPEVAAYHNDQVKKSLQMFGWDGIRYDNNGWNVWDKIATDNFGHRLIPQGADLEAMGADLVQRQRAEMEKVHPNFVFGDNGAGLAPGTQISSAADLAKAPKKWRASAERGGLVMEEGFSGWMHGGGTFEQMRATLHTGCRGVRIAGGYPYVIGPLFTSVGADSLCDMKTITALALASGAHLCMSGGAAPDELKRYLRQGARYSELLYSDGLQWVDSPETALTVQSPRAVWWKEYVRRRTLPDGRRQFLVHLINAPEHATFDAHRAGDKADPNAGERAPISDPDNKWALPPLVQKNVTVMIAAPAGIKVAKAFALSADGGAPQATPLELHAAGNAVTVTLPRLDYWSTVVFEGVARGGSQ